MSVPSNRVALVTGANKGIGRAIVCGLATRGMSTLLGARDEQRGRAAEAELRSEARDVRFVVLDVTDSASIAAAAAWIDAEYGHLDVLVNNAGITTDRGRPPSELSVEDLRAAYAVNVFGVVAVTNAMLPLLRRSPAARIVNLSSTQGSLTMAADAAAPYGGGPNVLGYNSSKTALNAITLAYANELRGTGILVNAASPGFVATDLNQHRGSLTPEEGATVPLYFATLGPDGPSGSFRNEDGTEGGADVQW